MDLASFIAGLPKAELHIHIEGSPRARADDGAGGPQRRSGLPHGGCRGPEAGHSLAATCRIFLDLYYVRACCVLLHEQDFYDLAMAYLERAAAAERAYMPMIFFDPQGHTSYLGLYQDGVVPRASLARF